MRDYASPSCSVCPAVVTVAPYHPDEDVKERAVEQARASFEGRPCGLRSCAACAPAAGVPSGVDLHPEPNPDWPYASWWPTDPVPQFPKPQRRARLPVYPPRDTGMYDDAGHHRAASVRGWGPSQDPGWEREKLRTKLRLGHGRRWGPHPAGPPLPSAWEHPSQEWPLDWPQRDRRQQERQHSAVVAPEAPVTGPSAQPADDDVAPVLRRGGAAEDVMDIADRFLSGRVGGGQAVLSVAAPRAPVPAPAPPPQPTPTPPQPYVGTSRAGFLETAHNPQPSSSRRPLREPTPATFGMPPPLSQRPNPHTTTDRVAATAPAAGLRAGLGSRPTSLRGPRTAAVHLTASAPARRRVLDVPPPDPLSVLRRRHKRAPASYDSYSSNCTLTTCSTCSTCSACDCDL